MRISDADRERAVARLNDAVAEGRLTLDELEERVHGVLQARTAAEVAPHLADLPGGPATAPEQGELRSTMSTLRRRGRWTVPRRLAVRSKAGSIRLDFTEAVMPYPIIELALDVLAGSVTLVLPEGASVNVEQMENDMVASTVKVRKVPTATDPVGRPHIVVTGRQMAGTLVVRHQYRFLRWRW